MKYYLNGSNLATYGLTITNGVNAFMQFPERKDSISNDFEDEDGIDIDLFAPKLKARNFLFDCTLVGNDITDFKTKYFALFQLLKQQNSYTLFNDFLNIIITVYYIKQESISGLYNVPGGKYGIRFQLQFGEADPTTNIPTVELVDDLYNILVP